MTTQHYTTMASSSSSSPLSIFFSLLFFSAAVSAVKLSLSPFSHLDGDYSLSSGDPYPFLSRLATASVARSRFLKNPNSKHSSSSSAVSASAAAVKPPLAARSYGGYSVSLSFGKPPQTLPFVFDTGSSLVWFPCTSRYLCSDCLFSNVDPNQIPRFIPKNSTTTRIIGCQSPKCKLLFGPSVKCQRCGPNTQNCTEACPPYIIQYGLGSTAGILLSETLDFTDLAVPDFLVGCSILSTRQPEGIAGFGRGPESLPAQMGLKRFSYCLVSRRFDDTAVTSDLVLETGSGSKKTPGLIYTPFRKNPNVSNVAFQDYYYVNLRRIYVGGKRVKIPYEFLAPGSDGNGGSIVDSGSTFTFLERPVYDLVAKEFETQMGNYSRDTRIEKLTGLGPCFNISGDESVTVPDLVFEFKGGAQMKLPVSNFFSFVGSSDNVCLTVVSETTVNPTGVRSGPAIIVGSFQQQNYQVEFDLENERFGFMKKRCNS
ncbi:PREDICTED: probable aspartyl protease At4g16563 [Tarenaya hassleriana]|uniref:probable aspartyl protease At4g16563 n=1 Tax=Tarenaya hassleriana TaxID=28532 RepID=UPI00053C570A|nr:PREDICTED: probable aspartyl protease At4g16563 [Tarenaya hassleriana]